MFSSQLWEISYSIGKSLLILAIVIYILNLINPETATIVRNLLTQLFNFGTSHASSNEFIKEKISTVSSKIIDYFKKDNIFSTGRSLNAQHIVGNRKLF